MSKELERKIVKMNKELETKIVLKGRAGSEYTLEEIINIIDCASEEVDYGFDEAIVGYIRKSLTELEELKATVKELLDIPITVSTFSGTSLLIKTMNKLEKLVGDKDE